MQVLMLPRYGRLGASSRIRFYQYVPGLEAAGISIMAAPLFSDGYVRGLQKNTKNLCEAARAYARRVQSFLNMRRFDLLWIEKEALPWLPTWFEKMLLSSVVPYVLDYDDAVFHYYDQHRNPILRTLLAGKHPSLIQRAALVVAGNAYLADFALAAGARQVVHIPTVIDLERYSLANLNNLKKEEPPLVGWIGQRATATFLTPYVPLFKRLIANGQARFTAIGIDAPSFGLPMSSIQWAEDTEVASIGSFDIGIMPLVDEPFERGKCGYKLVQYMACGLPVVASPVGVNRQIVEHGVNGFLAETPNQWERALSTLLKDAGLRHRMGQKGRQKVEAHYSLQVTGPKMAQLLSAAATGQRPLIKN